MSRVSVVRMLRYKHTKTQRKHFQNPSVSLKRVIKKLCFRDGLVWTVGLTVEIKVRFRISPA